MYTILHSFLFNRSMGEAVVNFLSMITFLILVLLITHITICSAGFMFTDAELMRDTLLN